MRLLFLTRRCSTTATPLHNVFIQEMKTNFIPTNSFQRILLSCGSAAISLLNPHRGDMIACLGEVTSGNSLKYMRQKMLESDEGAEILKMKPRINSKTVSFQNLAQMPENTLGRVYADFMKVNNITADSRLPVQFIDDPELAYVMQRYREVHDLVHATLYMNTNMLGEVTIKWVEGIQTKLPMCVSGGIWGAGRLKPKHRQLYLKYYLPWAIKTGNTAKFMQGIYFEKRWEQDIADFHKEMNIVKLIKKITSRPSCRILSTTEQHQATLARLPSRETPLRQHQRVVRVADDGDAFVTLKSINHEKKRIYSFIIICSYSFIIIQYII